MGFPMQRNPFFWLVILALLWGPGAMLIKIAVHDIPPLTLSAVRVGMAAILLYGFLRSQKHTLPRWGSAWRHFAVMGLAANALPYTLFSWGEQYIDSSLASILLGTVPIFTMVLAHIFTQDEHLTLTKVVGVLLGFAGMIALVGPTLVAGTQATTWGLVAATGAAASNAVAIVYARKHLRGLPPLVAPTAQLLLATLYLVPLALLIERPYTLPLPPWTAVGALVGLAVLSTALAFVIYYRVMERATATYMSMVTYMIPMVGLALGMLVLHERPGWNAFLGFALIILGIMKVNGLIHGGHFSTILSTLRRKAQGAKRIVSERTV